MDEPDLVEYLKELGGLAPDLIVFNRLKITDVDFFDFSNNNNTSATVSIKTEVAKWYYALRNISISISLLVLIYIGIRMAVSSVAEDKARYKKMFMDWLVSFALLFMLNYIMIIIIYINDSLVKLIYEIYKGQASNTTLAGYGVSLTLKMYSPFLTVGIASIIVYGLLIGVTLALFVMYMKRMLTVGFLIIIAPLITITYSIDKIKDNESQALNTWLKEFAYNILIQPFHCIIFAVFVSTAVNLMSGGGSFSKAIIAVMCIQFIFKAEGIVRNIFGFEKSKSLGTAVAAGALVGSAFSKASELGKAGKTATGAVGATKTATGSSKPPKVNAGKTKDPNSLSSRAKSAVSTVAQRGKDKVATKAENFLGNHEKIAGAISSVGGAVGTVAEKAGDLKIGQAIGNSLKDNQTFEKVKDNTVGRLAHPIRTYKSDFKTGTKFAVGIAAGLITAGATGEMLYGVGVGKSVQNYMDNKNAQNQTTSKKTENNQNQALANAYQNYKNANPDLTDDQIADNTEAFLNADPEDYEDDPNTAEYIKALQDTQNLYEQLGRENVKEELDKVLASIQAEEIKPIGSKPRGLAGADQQFVSALGKLEESLIETGSENIEIDVAQVNSKVIQDIASPSVNTSSKEYLNQFHTEERRNYAKSLLNLNKQYQKKSVLGSKQERIAEALEKIQNKTNTVLPAETEDTPITDGE